MEQLVRVVADGRYSVKELLSRFGLKDRESFMGVYLAPALRAGLVRMLYPGSPRHPRQKYLLTGKGLALWRKEEI